jgi:hypothetical protein
LAGGAEFDRVGFLADAQRAILTGVGHHVARIEAQRGMLHHLGLKRSRGGSADTAKHRALVAKHSAKVCSVVDDSVKQLNVLVDALPVDSLRGLDKATDIGYPFTRDKVLSDPDWDHGLRQILGDVDQSLLTKVDMTWMNAAFEYARLHEEQVYLLWETHGLIASEGMVALGQYRSGLRLLESPGEWRRAPSLGDVDSAGPPRFESAFAFHAACPASKGAAAMFFKQANKHHHRFFNASKWLLTLAPLRESLARWTSPPVPTAEEMRNPHPEVKLQLEEVTDAIRTITSGLMTPPPAPDSFDV